MLAARRRSAAPFHRDAAAAAHDERRVYECERVYAGHEGPPTPRLYEFSTREVAAALARVGEGMSYRHAAKVFASERAASGSARTVSSS